MLELLRPGLDGRYYSVSWEKITTYRVEN
jgi:hypothetical protein